MAAGPGVVTGRSGSIGNVFYIEEDFWPLNTVLYVKDFHGNDPKFVYYLLTHFDLAKFAGGAGVPTLNRNSVHTVPVAIPKTIAEQQRIVAILDEAFAGLKTATANAERNFRNARELFASYLNSAFQSDNDWEETTLGAIAEFKNGLNFSKSSKGEKIRIVGVRDFQDNFWVPNEDLDYAQIDGGLSDAYELRRHDILTVRSNGNKQLIGRCILASDVLQKTSHSGFTIRIRVTRPDVNPEYLVRFLKSDATRKALIESGDGAQISNLNQQALTALPVRLLDAKKQQALVSCLGEIETGTSRLAASYEQKMADLAELKQSILRKAFSGELSSPPSQALREAAE